MARMLSEISMHLKGLNQAAKTGPSQSLAAGLCCDFSDRPQNILFRRSASSTPTQHLNRVNSPIAPFTLSHVTVRDPQEFGQSTLGQTGFFATPAKLVGEQDVGRVMQGVSWRIFP